MFVGLAVAERARGGREGRREREGGIGVHVYIMRQKKGKRGAIPDA